MLRLTRRSLLGASAAAISGCAVSSTSDLGSFKRRRSPLQLNAVDRYRHFLALSGQSNAEGRPPPVTRRQPFENERAIDGRRVPLIEDERESIASAAANMLTVLSPGRSLRSIVTNSSRGASGYDLLKPGTFAYRQLTSRLGEVADQMNGAEDALRALALLVVHGETDNRDGKAPQYPSFLREWQSTFERDARAITLQLEPVPLITDQMSSWTFHRVTPAIALAQLSVSEEPDAPIFCVGPKYQYEYEDGLHLKPDQFQWLGEQFGKVMARIFIDGDRWRPLCPREVVLDDDSLIASFWVPVPPLVFDNIRVREKPNHGFELLHPDGVTLPPIAGTEILGGDTVRIRCAGKIPAGTRLGYALSGAPGAGAGPGNLGDSARGNLRDSDATRSFHGTWELFNWCCHFDAPVLS